MSRILQKLSFFAGLLLSLTTFAQGSTPHFAMAGIPETNSFYNPLRFREDALIALIRSSLKSQQKIAIKSMTFRFLEPPTLQEVVPFLKNPEKTLVCESTLTPEEILALTDDPDQLIVRGDKTYIVQDNEVRYVSRVESDIPINNSIVNEVRQDLFKLRDDCSRMGLTPDIFSIKHKGNHPVITAFRSASTGRIYLYQRYNSGGVQLLKRGNAIYALNR